jgi:hypothetical protein
MTQYKDILRCQVWCGRHKSRLILAYNTFLLVAYRSCWSICDHSHILTADCCFWLIRDASVRAYGLNFGPGSDPMRYAERKAMTEAEKMNLLIQTERTVRL